MSDVFATIIFVFAIYCAWAIAFQPKRNVATVEPESQPINYFPEVEEDTEPEPKPITIVEPRPAIAAFVAPKTIANSLKEEAVKADIVRPDYASMSIRQLKAECQKLTGTDRAIAGYSRLNRQQLITALSAS